jgi:hypothetical protein
LPDVVLCTDLETAWRTWTLEEATGWRFLPNAGGLLDQDESLLQDVLAIAALNERLKKLDQANG